MATITKTKAGTFKAVIRKNQKIIKTKTFKLKKSARDWAQKIPPLLSAQSMPAALMVRVVEKP